MPTVQVQLEERDYVNAARAAARPGVRTVIALGIGSALVIVGAFSGGAQGTCDRH